MLCEWRLTGWWSMCHGPGASALTCPCLLPPPCLPMVGSWPLSPWRLGAPVPPDLPLSTETLSGAGTRSHQRGRHVPWLLSALAGAWAHTGVSSGLGVCPTVSWGKAWQCSCLSWAGIWQAACRRTAYLPPIQVLNISWCSVSSFLGVTHLLWIGWGLWEGKMDLPAPW